MAIISLKCNNLLQIHSSAENSIIGRRSADTSLAEICQEMSELLDKQVNAQKMKTFGVHASSCKPTKSVQ